MSEVVHVAVGVVVSSEQKILIAKRPDNLHQGGLWEFPGGKVEEGESVQQALSRELLEEVAILPQRLESLMELTHHYGDKSVCLDVWWVDRFSGKPEGCEGQMVRWVGVDELSDYDFPAANYAIIDSINARLIGG